VSDFREALEQRVLIADGAMGTMLQAQELAVADFAGYPGCNEILNLTRPDAVAAVHRGYLQAGADLIETNTFGANLTALQEYELEPRIAELAAAGVRIAREVADEFTDRRRYVLASIGPGTKLPSLGQIGFAALRDSYQRACEAMAANGADAFSIETCQDLLQAKAAVIGARRANAALGSDLPILVSVTVETTGTMLVGSDISAALVAISALGVDSLGLNCGTGPEQMREHLRVLSRTSPVRLQVMPNAGLPELTDQGARYPLGPAEFATQVSGFTDEFGLSIVGGCCGTTPDHIAELRELVGAHQPGPIPEPTRPAALSSLYSQVPLRQADDASGYLIVGERTNANGSKAFREAMLAGHWEQCLDIARKQSDEGAHLLDVCVDYVGRDGVADIRELASRLATAVPLPVMLDSTDPAVIEAGLECLAGRSVINSVNYEDGGARLAALLPIAIEHGAAVVALTIDEAGQARTTEWKLRVADRLIGELAGKWGLRSSDIIVDCLTFPIGTGQEETRKDALATIEAIRRIKQKYPEVNTTLGVSNVSFGLNPAARMVLNSVFLDEALKAGLTSAIVHPSKILPLASIPAEQHQVALDLIYDRRSDGYDPLSRFLELFADVTAGQLRSATSDALAGLPVAQRLHRRVVNGIKTGLEDDLDEALRDKPALEIINDDLLSGMKEVGELFGSGKMQLPFVLTSAEVMKAAVKHLEPHIVSGDASARGTLVLATVAGDVHDIGKNLVDIILSNNGYRVVNLGIKQPISAIAEAAVEVEADAIGMSGLLVKSTQVMRDNLAELDARGLSHVPVLLGGAALTRSFVEDTLNSEYPGEVRYARDAFEGLSLMEEVVSGALREPKSRVRTTQAADRSTCGEERSDVSRGEAVPTPPFWGSRKVTGVPLDEVAEWLDLRATFAGQWGLRGDLSEGLPRLRHWLDYLRTERLAEPSVVYGYWPCHSVGNELVLTGEGGEVARLRFPRQTGGRRLCLADFFRDEAEAAKLGPDVVGLQLVTLGPLFSGATAQLFAEDSYRDYLELHGLGVQLTEALAEYWHARIRQELGFADSATLDDVLRHQAYQGSRYSFGYPACPDLEQRALLVDLLDPGRIQVTLSEEFQLHPELSTDAIIVHHREAKYFNAR
jgi:5-methyltetrahydrofolate--homocysteine methyltransferase